LFIHEKISVIVDHSWAMITTKSAHRVTCNRLRRLGHPARALDWVPRIIFIFFLFSSVTIPSVQLVFCFQIELSRFNTIFHRCRSVGWFLPTGRSVSVDIDGRFNCTYGRTRSISTVCLIPPTREHGWYWRSVWLHLRRITVDCRSSIIDRDNFVIDSTDDTCEIFPKNLELRRLDSWFYKKISFSTLNPNFFQVGFNRLNSNFFLNIWVRLTQSIVHVPLRGGRLTKNISKKPGPGRMTETPRAGTGDLAYRSWCYWCSIVLMRQDTLYISDTFLIRFLPTPDICG